MRVLAAALTGLSLICLATATPAKRDYATHDYFAVELDGLSPESVAEQLGVEVVEPLGELEGHWLLRREKGGLERREVNEVVARWEEMKARIGKRTTAGRGVSSRSLKSLQHLETRHRTKRAFAPSAPHRLRSPEQPANELFFAQQNLGLEDPMLDQQWHLINLEKKDIELNVTGLWARSVTGQGVKVAIIDDGLDAESDDLRENFYPEGSYDFNDHTPLPLPRLSDDQHGTRCAGEIAAVPNKVCGVGVAYGAKVAGIRILSAPISDADEAAALNYEYQLNDIYSCSWGPPDDGKSMEGPEGLILKAMVNGVQKGRAGKGSIFIFAAGNGGGADDQCNFDGYTNSIFSLSIGAMDRKGLHPYYSELCAAMIAVAPSSGSGDHIHTTDVGKDKCAHTHGGTSAAAPLAAGVVALALQVRPDLSWRDIQHIVVRSAIYFNEGDPDWEETAAKRQFSYKYGYGRIDAGLLVEAAETWKLVKPQAWYDSPMISLPTDPVPEQPEQPGAQTGEAEVAGGNDGSNVPRQEGDTAENHLPDLPTELQPAIPVRPPTPPPTGTIITSEGVQSSYEVTQEMLSESNFERLEHLTVRVWVTHQRRGDVEVQVTSPSGVKSVMARQRRLDEATTGFVGWKFMSMKHWDENPVGIWTIQVRDQVNPDKVGRFQGWSLQLWGECADASLAQTWQLPVVGQPDEEQVGSRPPSTTSKKPKPTQLLPGDHGEAEGEAEQPGLTKPTAAPAANEDEAEHPAPPAPADEGVFDGMNALANNSTWLAGAALIVLLAGAGVGAFLWLRARRRKRSLFGDGGRAEDRGSYAPVSEDVPMGTLGRRSKSGEGGSKGLYDAFGEASDEDDDDVDEDADLDERAALKYHDDFLGDDEEPSSSASKGDGGEYKDDEEVTPAGGALAGPGSGGSGSSSSWQDAEEEVKRP